MGAKGRDTEQRRGGDKLFSENSSRERSKEKGEMTFVNIEFLLRKEEGRGEVEGGGRVGGGGPRGEKQKPGVWRSA